MRRSKYLPAAALLAALIAAPAASAQAASTQAASAQVSDSTEVTPVMKLVLATIRDEFPFGRVLVDRVVADTTRRLAPPLMSGKTHKLPELWATPNRAEIVQTEMLAPQCRAGNVDCTLPDGVAATVGFSEPTITGDKARVIVRYSKNTGASFGHVATTVEAITLQKLNGDWKVVGRKVRAAA
jgi:hypothetical protein